MRIRGIVTAVVLLGTMAVANPALFIAGELVPFSGGASYAVPFLELGAYWPTDGLGFAFSLGMDNPLTLNGWYQITFDGRYKLSKAAWLALTTSLWLNFVDFTWDGSSTWSVGVKAGATFGEHVLAYASFNLPLQVDPNAPLLGSWLSAGIGFEFEPLVGGAQ